MSRISKSLLVAIILVLSGIGVMMYSLNKSTAKYFPELLIGAYAQFESHGVLPNTSDVKLMIASEDRDFAGPITVYIWQEIKDHWKYIYHSDTIPHQQPAAIQNGQAWARRISPRIVEVSIFNCPGKLFRVLIGKKSIQDQGIIYEKNMMEIDDL